MGILLVWLTVLGVVPWVLRQTARGAFTTEHAAFILIGVTAVAALPRRIRRCLPVLGGLVLFAREFSHGDPNMFWAILWQLMALAYILLGLAFMMRGLVGGSRE
jgi:hypothetical protein